MKRRNRNTRNGRKRRDIEKQGDEEAGTVLIRGIKIKGTVKTPRLFIGQFSSSGTRNMTRPLEHARGGVEGGGKAESMYMCVSKGGGSEGRVESEAESIVYVCLCKEGDRERPGHTHAPP